MHVITFILICTGILFILVAAIGIIRMPDVFTRMSVVSKAVTFGVGFILMGVVIHFNDTSIFIKVAVIYVFLSFSTSVAASVIGLAAYRDRKSRLSGRTFLDELSEDEKQENN